MASLQLTRKSSTTSRWNPESILPRAAAQGGVLECVLDHVLAELGAARAVLLRGVSGDLVAAAARAGSPPAAFPGTEAIRTVLIEGLQCFTAPRASSEASWCLGLRIALEDGTPRGLFIEGPSGARNPLPPPAGDDRQGLVTLVSLACIVDDLAKGAPHRAEEARLPREASAPSDPAVSRPERQHPGAAELVSLFPGIVGESKALRNALSAVADLASSDIPVLIEGESGTGKELIASAIHRLSSRAEKPFVGENCGAIPEHLVESELFGYEKGSFTGAAERKPGLLERAHGGTLFLDEVGELELQVQKKLLRVLQEREVRRIGGSMPRPVDFRVISATNRDLEQMVADRLFREDLFYRLHVAHLRLPPLRDRAGDIPLLIRHFNIEYARQLERPPLSFSDEVLALLSAYPWPGNVRELRNEVWRLASTVRGPVRPEHLSRRVLGPPPRRPASSRPGRLDDVEREVLGAAILDALETTRGNHAEAARLLGIGRGTLYRRLARYGIRYVPPQEDPAGEGGSKPQRRPNLR